jgi:hypothetical protein
MRVRHRLVGVAEIALVVVVSSALGCSVPEPAVAPDPATAVTANVAQAAIDAPLHAKFRFGASHHLSCSLSWESTSEWGNYELTLTPPHAAKLHTERHHDTRFGSNGKVGSTTYDEGSSKDDLEGTVGRVGDELRIELHDVGQSCASVASKDSPCSSLSLKCKATKVKVTTYDDEGSQESLMGALRCTPGVGLPLEIVEKGGDDALVFGDGKTLELEYSEYGFGAIIGPILHVSPID